MYPICYATTIFLSKFPILAKKKVWCCWEKGWDLVCVCEMKPQAWEELQHSLKANKSLELLCSSRPKKGRVVVGSLKILCLLLSKLSSLGCSVLQFGLHFTMLAEKKTFVHSSFLFLTPNDRKKTEFYHLLPFLVVTIFNTSYYLQGVPYYFLFKYYFLRCLKYKIIYFDCFPA